LPKSPKTSPWRRCLLKRKSTTESPITQRGATSAVDAVFSNIRRREFSESNIDWMTAGIYDDWDLTAKTAVKPTKIKPTKVKSPAVKPTNVKPTDLFGNRVYSRATPSRQLTLFDKTEYQRTERGTLAVIRRENGEKAVGTIDVPNQYKAIKKPTFTANESGKQYSIPLSSCTVTWVDDIAVISIPEIELSRRVSLYGMFASCCLF